MEHIKELLQTYSWLSVVVRLALPILLGSLIGAERARHGQAAGMRTHAIVCIGGALTALTSVFVSQSLGYEGDVFRISAQVISGIGFLGAGMIIVKGNNAIMGLTTAAGLWMTGAIGVACGYGFYGGALLCTLFGSLTMVLMAKLERAKRTRTSLYVELDDMHLTNRFIERLRTEHPDPFEVEISTPKSGNSQHIGLYIASRTPLSFTAEDLLSYEAVVLALGE